MKPTNKHARPVGGRKGGGGEKLRRRVVKGSTITEGNGKKRECSFFCIGTKNKY